MVHTISLDGALLGLLSGEEYPCEILAKRQKEGFLDEFPIWNMDIREFNRRIAPMYQGLVDVITAGFPCQPFSVAGKQKGADDERNMWPATWDTIRIIQPRYCFLENVPAPLLQDTSRLSSADLPKSGMMRDGVLSAADVAPHIRKRLWIVAKSRTLANAKRSDGEWGLPRTSGRSVDKVTHSRQRLIYWPMPRASNLEAGRMEEAAKC